MHRFTGPLVAVVVLCMSQFAPGSVSARDDGRYANEPLHAWFDQLGDGASGAGELAEAGSPAAPQGRYLACFPTAGGQLPRLL